ncbi:hypothetical protein [Cupriavidus basilensis]|uniref:hypothetical protein n=1 Tax=Cupriavidus basilensis TaxID=68895 RepID=UPI003D33A1A6
MLRAYGRHECLARVKNNLLHVIQAQAWREPHALPPGELDHVDGERLVISCTGDSSPCSNGTCWRRARRAAPRRAERSVPAWAAIPLLPGSLLVPQRLDIEKLLRRRGIVPV